ncbi:hypothetical protein NQZ68_032775 [Dissostichus eleginoides]|nr:hypothetical protein NQZ68_032775 [Dissostichus eleginoides]
MAIIPCARLAWRSHRVPAWHGDHTVGPPGMAITPCARLALVIIPCARLAW